MKAPTYDQIERILIEELELDVISADPRAVMFWYKGNRIQFFMKKQWATGKGIQDGRGWDKLYRQIKPDIDKSLGFTSFTPSIGQNQFLPPEKKYVLCIVDNPEEGVKNNPVVVGYLKYAAGDKSCPYFVTPGVTINISKESHAKRVIAWCDCLPEKFVFPLTHLQNFIK